jgi:hypothetical protein
MVVVCNEESRKFFLESTQMNHRIVAPTGNALKAPFDPLAILLNLSESGHDDAQLFRLFAILAERAGRTDLQDEFKDRASSHSIRDLEVGRPHSSASESDRLQKDGCRLLREKKLSEAETAFRKAIKLDPSCGDAHGNLGVAYAQQKKLPEARSTEPSRRPSLLTPAWNSVLFQLTSGVAIGIHQGVVLADSSGRDARIGGFQTHQHVGLAGPSHQPHHAASSIQ